MFLSLLHIFPSSLLILQPILFVISLTIVFFPSLQTRLSWRALRWIFFFFLTSPPFSRFESPSFFHLFRRGLRAVRRCVSISWVSPLYVLIIPCGQSSLFLTDCEGFFFLHSARAHLSIPSDEYCQPFTLYPPSLICRISQ